MLKIASVVFAIIIILAGLLFVRKWNSATPWGAGTGTISGNSVSAG